MNLLELARKTIEAKLNKESFEVPQDIKNLYGEPGACFVTITNNGDLRGCIGSLNASKPLFKDVQDNSINAGFRDPRFLPLTKDELPKIKIEISLLSKPKKLDYTTKEELLKKLDKTMGVVLKKGFYSATFLPQVWKELQDKTKFLESLSMKAGLEKEEWKNAEIWVYTVDVMKE